VPDALLGDQARFRQILLNLVSNAIKFTETGGVSIDIHAADVGERSVGLQIAVRDTGIGIAADRLDAIFRPFTQGDDATTRRFGGTGLGLTICRQLAEKMQGRLWVESAPGAGSTFFCALRFDIQPDSHAIFGDVSEKLGVSGVPQSPAGLPELLRPVSNLGPALAADEPAAERSGAGPRVLLAEDNAINQRLAQEILRQHGFEVKVVENGHEAVAAVEKESFDLILMDLEMPELDGLGATKEIRRRELSSGRHIPIVAVTAHAMSGVQQTCQEAGMDGYLTKPFKRAELIELMRGLIPKHRPVVDWDAAMLSVDGSETLLFELCHIFLQDAPPLLAEAAEEVAAASMDAFAHSIHRLGGMMALFVSPQVRDLGRRLEESGKRADPVVVASLWPQFQDVAERLVAELSHRSAPTGPIRA
jgi:CheY-like chemotaxis protein